MQPDPSIMQEGQSAKPAQKSYGMLVAVVILALAVIGLGVWGFMQTSALKDTQAQLADLQAKHTALTTERDNLSSSLKKTTSELDATKSELETTKTTLEATTAELETTKADLAKSKDETSALQAKIDTAMKYVEVLTGFWIDSFDTMESKIDATGDSSLQAPFNALVNGGGLTEIIALQQALFDAIATVLE